MTIELTTTASRVGDNLCRKKGKDPRPGKDRILRFRLRRLTFSAIHLVLCSARERMQLAAQRPAPPLRRWQETRILAQPGPLRRNALLARVGVDSRHIAPEAP